MNDIFNTIGIFACLSGIAVVAVSALTMFVGHIVDGKVANLREDVGYIRSRQAVLVADYKKRVPHE